MLRYDSTEGVNTPAVSIPGLRRAPAKAGKPVAFDDVMDALRALDAAAMESSSRYKRILRKRRGSGQSGHGQSLQ